MGVASTSHLLIPKQQNITALFAVSAEHYKALKECESSFKILFLGAILSGNKLSLRDF